MVTIVEVDMVEMKSTVSKRVLILRTRSLIRTFLVFWVLIRSLLVLGAVHMVYLKLARYIHRGCQSRWDQVSMIV